MAFEVEVVGFPPTAAIRRRSRGVLTNKTPLVVNDH